MGEAPHAGSESLANARPSVTKRDSRIGLIFRDARERELWGEKWSRGRQKD